MNKLSEYITDSILSKKSGIYAEFPEKPDYNTMLEWLERNGFKSYGEYDTTKNDGRPMLAGVGLRYIVKPKEWVCVAPNIPGITLTIYFHNRKHALVKWGEVCEYPDWSRVKEILGKWSSGNRVRESVLARKSGMYKFPYGELTLQEIVSVLEGKGYKSRPSVLDGSAVKDHLRASCIGQNYYFIYRDSYSYELIVSSDNDRKHALAFDVLPFPKGKIGMVSVIGEDGKEIPGETYITGKKDIEIGDLVKKFLGI